VLEGQVNIIAEEHIFKSIELEVRRARKKQARARKK